MKWNVKETSQLVRNIYGREAEKRVYSSGCSVGERMGYAKYHFFEVERLTTEFESQHMADLRSLWEIHAEGQEEAEQAFYEFIWGVGANAIAAVQSLHSIPDIFSHVVYYSVNQGLSRTPLGERDISLQAVVTAIRELPDLSSVRRSLLDFQSGPGWSHLAAICNKSKHCSVIRPSYNEDMTGLRERLREVRFMDFEYDGKGFCATSVLDVLKPEFERINKLVLASAVKLDQYLNSLSQADESSPG